ncbi:hypothetical protein HHK36_021050 [Tetracentron sinense]|uniref:K Homology domain-containing protein n=1 Tax=Tetracentron sinense TaxID=13715 RepID=A0A834YUE3_TETSI|nr:hypothetical protein HHK36_021050 [Tetracentron sinense]
MASSSPSETTENGTEVPECDPLPATSDTESDSDQLPQEIAAPATEVTAAAAKKWPGWPGHNVFRLVIPVLKVGSIIGRKGELIKKMCKETRARIGVLDGAIGTTDRIVLISGKEKLEAQISPAMDAVLRVFKRVAGLSDGEGGATGSAAAGIAICSVRLLVSSSQAISLIGKQGLLIKSIQESSGAHVRVLSGVFSRELSQPRQVVQFALKNPAITYFEVAPPGGCGSDNVSADLGLSPSRCVGPLSPRMRVSERQETRPPSSVSGASSKKVPHLFGTQELDIRTDSGQGSTMHEGGTRSLKLVHSNKVFAGASQVQRQGLVMLPQMHQEDVSDWVLNQMEEVGKELGLSLDGHVSEGRELFQRIEGGAARGRVRARGNPVGDERIVDIQGESLKVLKALEAVVGHLRKFLVDHSVIPIFEKSYNATISQDRAVETWADKTQSLLRTASQTAVSSDYPLSLKRDSLFLDRETQLESQIRHSGLSPYGQDSGLAGLRSSGLGRAAVPIVTQITQTMQIPLSYAEDIIGIGGTNIAYIRRTSGAMLTVQESRGLPDEIIVEIKGTSSQVQTAQQLIQEFLSSHKEPATSSYNKFDSGLRSYSQLTNTSYPPSSFSTQSLGGYGSSGVGGGYSSFRL